MFEWMNSEVDKLGLELAVRAGGLIIDEMSIQEDISLINKGVKFWYAGTPSITRYCDILIERRKGKYSRT